MSRIYVTTAIPYVNAAPHLGHALELVQVDALARSWRARGHEVRALTGTDDNAGKNVAAALAAGVPVDEFVRVNGDRFLALAGPLDLSFDDVIRTASDPRHAVGVERLWRTCAAAGDLYQADYEGLYCTGCEAFLDSDELDDSGRCTEHGVEPEPARERNWFFRLSRYRDRILAAIDRDELRIEPAARRNEVVAALRAGLRDFSVSRPVARADGWGIRVPDDPSQVVYVWFDALANYLTALGRGDDEQRWWHASDDRVHVIGKGIVRFHALYWPAILASAGLPLPSALFVHDYLTIDGAKISKSAGNGIDPAELVARAGTDAVRWWLLRESPTGVDTDFAHARFVATVNADLAHGYGNLVTRVATLVRRLRPARFEATAPAPAADVEIDRAVDAFDFRRATRRVLSAVDAANRALETARPWELARRDPGDARIDDALADALDRCRAITAGLAPFVPATAARGAARLRGDAEAEAVPVFPRLEDCAPRPTGPSGSC